MSRRWKLVVVGLVALLVGVGGQGAAPAGITNPILFVGQFPHAADFATIGSTFGNHRAEMDRVGRGGGLFLLFPNGTLRDLTQEAGYGTTGNFIPPQGWVGPPPAGFQDGNAIAVRDPAVHWSGTKAVFSMVIGAPTQRYQQISPVWQLYEVTGLGAGQTATITRVPNQPAAFNNVSPIYASDGQILFTSDRPRGGEPHLYPQLDEYESTATVTGLWKLDPVTGALQLLQHSPSGSFSPTIDRTGRIVFTRWDHLQRDQQADPAGNPYGAFDYADETAAAARNPTPTEFFPERRQTVGNVEGFTINHFFPWTLRQDGTEEETLNHIGRHELHSYFNRSFNDDAFLDEFIDDVSGRFNPNAILNFFHIEEDPLVDGRFWGTEAPEFGSHASGQIVRLNGAAGTPGDQMAVTYVTHPDTRGTTPSPNHSGHYRDPAPLSNGDLVAAHTAYQGEAGNDGTRQFPNPRYRFRLKNVVSAGAYHTAGTVLTGGITRSIAYWDPDELVRYTGELWELQPVEVRARPVPPATVEAPLAAPEATAFALAGVNPGNFKTWLAQRGLALVVSRNVTTRDVADRQQPFNLKVDHSTTQTIGQAQAPVYPVAYMQFFQGDQVRGYGGVTDPNPGRRVLARVMHDPATAANPPSTGPAGSVRLGDDGSLAAMVPARRALSWQLVGSAAQGFPPVVRERYWLTFQPGEVRVCTSCHGVNSVDQAGGTAPTNTPQALIQLLQHWRTTNSGIFADGFEAGSAGAWSAVSP
ncbi:MAG: hypothetical protein SF066_11575 [Thermoanaerobaculia bacterium]|nr:hypothetical protein [Thermoanaerobaculia bacterium]